MKISPTRARTHNNPTEGVAFSTEDNATIRNAIAREVIWLEQVGDWTAGEAELARREGLELALLTYQATYTAGVIKHMARQQS